MAGSERERLLRAVAPVLAEQGYEGMTVEALSVRAGLDEVAFRRHFRDKRDCVLAAHDRVFNRLAAELGGVCARESDPPQMLAAAITAAIDFIRSAPQESLLLVLDTVAADPMLAARVLASNDLLVGLLRQGRGLCPHAASLPELTEMALVGAATSLIGNRLLAGEADGLRDLRSELVELVLIPYVGRGEARRIALASGGPTA